MAQALSEMTGPIRALFTDVDGTLTTNGRIEARTYAALEGLTDVGLPIILVTGRPAGWGQALMSMTPVTTVIAENGGVAFVQRGGKLDRLYGVPASMLPEWRRRMRAAAMDVMQEVPGARLSNDSKYREVDMAIDWNEESSLSLADAQYVTDMLRKAGFAASRSSVHVNFGPPEINKWSACKRLIKEVLGGDPDDTSGYVYVGDSLNDASMFDAFERSVGVANVKRWWDELGHKPKFLTQSAEGAGLREVIAHISSLRT